MVEPGAELAEKVTLALMELQNRKENEAGTLDDGSGLREMIVCFLSECKPSKENLTCIPEKLRHISKALALLAELCENDRVRIHGSIVEYLDTNIKDIQDIILTVPLPQRLDIWDSFMIIFVRNGLGSSKHIDQICRSIQPAFSEKDPNIISRTLVSWARMIRQFDLSAADEDRRVCLLVTPLMFAKERFQCQDAVCDTWIALCRATGKKITYYFEPTVLSLLRYCAGGTMVFVTPDRIGKHLKKAISVNSTKLFCPEIEELMRSPIWSPEKHMKYLQSTFNNPLRTTRLLPLIARVLGLNSSEEKLSSHDPLEARECMSVASVFFMQLIRLLSANAIKDEHMEMLEKCVVEIGIKMCKVLEGKQLIDSLSNYCIQMRAWIVESKLPFHFVAGALRDFLSRVDIKKLSTGCGDNWPIFDVFTSLFERFHTPAKSCHSLISSLLERFVELTVESKSDHVLSRLKKVADITVELAGPGTKRKMNPRHLFPVALRLMESLRRHIELHEDINDGGMSAPKFETLSRIAELPMSITRNFESPMDVLIPHEELCSAWKSLFATAHTEIKGEVACDYATTFKLFCELCTEYSKQLPETTLSCELFLSIVQCVDFAAIAACSSRTDSVAFDSLGQLSLAKETFGVLVEAFVEQSTQESKSSLGPFGAEFLSVSLSTLLKSAATFVSGSAQPSLVRSLFEAIVPSMAKLVHLQQEKGILIKKPAASFGELIIGFLDNSHRHICGPFDNELLTSCSALLVATLGHSDFKIRKAAQNFWKETFSQATQLSYPEELREVIRNCVSKGAITAPDVDDCMLADSLPSAITEKVNEQDKHKSSAPSSPFARPKSSSTNRRTPMSARGSAQKRSLRMALGPDEDSVDYAVIPPANKKIHLTEHQKEKYMEQRVANRLFVDEDSRQEPMWKTVPDIFESDSRSTTVTNKAMPKSVKAQAQCNGSEDATRDEADKEIRIETEQVDMRTPDKTEKSRDPTLQSPAKKSPSRSLTGTRDLSKSTTTATDFSGLAEDEQAGERPSENAKPKTTVVTPRSASGKRRSAIKLNFDDLPGSNPNSLNADDVANKPPQSEIVISSSDSDNSQQSGENGNVGRSSRRSQSKATPVRYVGTGSETRRRLGGVQPGLNRTAPEAVLATTPKSAKRGRPRKSLALNVNVEEDKENMKRGDGEAQADKPVDDECMVIEDESPPPEPEKQETHKKKSNGDDVMIIEESPDDEVFIGNDKSPEKAPDYRSPEKVNQAPTLATPKMMRRVFEQTTPGILRKIGSPFSAEKKSRRVHFGSSSSTEESTKENSQEKEIPVSTTTVQQVNVTPEKTPPSSAHKMAVTPPSGLRRGSASSSASTPNNEALGDSDDVLFPDLTSCKDPISAIINKLTLMKTGGAGSSGSMLLRKQLASKGVHTVGDLARMNPASIHSLPLRRPKVDTAKQALLEYLAKKNSATSPGRPEPVGASTSQSSEKGNMAPLDTLVSLPVDLGAKKANDFPIKQAEPISAQDDDISVVSTLVHEVLLPGEGATQALSKSFVEGLLNTHVKKERADTQPHKNEREPSIEQNTCSSAPALTTNTTVTLAPTPMEVNSTDNDKEQENHADLDATQPVEASQTTVAVSKHSQNAPLSAGELLAGVLKQSASQEEYLKDSKMLDDFFAASSLLKERIAALEGHSFSQEDMLRVFKELTAILMRGHEALAKGVGEHKE